MAQPSVRCQAVQKMKSGQHVEVLEAKEGLTQRNVTKKCTTKLMYVSMEHGYRNVLSWAVARPIAMKRQ